MTILYPNALWLLLLAVPIYLWAKHSFSHLSGFQRVLSLAIRLIILVLLVLALAGARWSRPVDRMGVMFVMDVSDSIPADLRDDALARIAETIKDKPKDDLVGLVTVGKEGAIELFPASAISPAMVLTRESEIAGNYTNLADGLRLAATSLPPGIMKRVVLITDGAENLGDVVGEAMNAVQEGVDLVTVQLSPEYDDEAEIDMLYAPSGVGEGETVGLRMVFASTVDQNARVILLVDGEYFGESQIALDSGKNSFSFPISGLEPGFHSFAVAIEAESDTTLENNRAFAFTRVAGRAGVLIASDDPSDTGVLDNTLNAHEIDTVRLNAQSLPTSLPEWLSYDTVVLSSIPAHHLGEMQMDQIAAAVRDFGHGLIMIGGEDSFGPGGYYKTKIEEALPVTMDFRRHALSPNMAIILLVDSSGSMSVSYGGYEKIALAREACIAVVEISEKSDYVGVLTFDSLPKWVIQPERDLNREAAISKIRQIVAGGGTEIFPALTAAEKALREIDAKSKHVILLSDGMTAPGDFSGIVDKLVDGGVTVTTVGIGSDADLAFMQFIAGRGGGNSYFTDDPYDLPRIFTRETFMANKGTIIETEFAAIPSSPNALVEGIEWGNAPSLLGYVAASEKPTAETPLRTPMADPLFSIWRYGLGKSAAFTSDAKNRWAAHWLSWDGYEKFWTSLVRTTSAAAQAPGYRARVDLDGDRGVIAMEVLEEMGGSTNLSGVDAHIVGPDMEESTVSLRQVGVGKYTGEFPIDENGTYLVNVIATSEDGTASATAGLAVSYSPEYKKLGADTFILSKLAAIGSNLNLTGEDIFGKGRVPQVQHYPAWELLVLIAMYLWLLDIAVRRMMWSREYLGMAADSWREYSERLRQARIRRGLIRENLSIRRLAERSRIVRERLGIPSAGERETEAAPEDRTAHVDEMSRARTREPAKKRAPADEGEVKWSHDRADDIDARASGSYHVRAKERLSKLRRMKRDDEPDE